MVSTLVVSLFSSNARCQYLKPRLDTISPPVATVGSSFELLIGGEAIDETSQLVFSAPGFSSVATMVPAGRFRALPTPKPRTFQVRVGAEVPPGVYSLRAVGRYGISNARRFEVAALPVRKIEASANRSSASQFEPNETIWGAAQAGAFLFHRITLTKGMDYLLEVHGHRIDSQLAPLVRVIDPHGKEIAEWGSNLPTDLAEPFTPTETGEYVIAIADQVYEGGPRQYYALSIHTQPRLLRVFPPLVQQGAVSFLSAVGARLSGSASSPANRVIGSCRCEIEVPTGAVGIRDGYRRGALPTWHWRSPLGDDTTLPIGLTNLPVIVEAKQNQLAEQAEQITWPCHFVGQFSPRGDEDWLTIATRKGEGVRISLRAAEFGQGADPVLRLQRLIEKDDSTDAARWEEISTSDDVEIDLISPWHNGSVHKQSSDPVVTLTPDRDTIYRICLHDAFHANRGADDLIYACRIERAEPTYHATLLPAAEQADANKDADPTGWTLRSGGTVALPVQIARRDGHDRPVWIWAKDLPPGLSARPVVARGDQRLVHLVISAATTAGAWTGKIRIVTSESGPTDLIAREVEYTSLVWGSDDVNNIATVVRQDDHLRLAVIPYDAVPITADLQTESPVSLPVGETLTLPVHLTRVGYEGDVAFSLQGIDGKFVELQNATITGDEGEVRVTFLADKATPGWYTLLLKAEPKIAYVPNPQRPQALQHAIEFIQSVVKQQTELTEAKKGEATSIEERIDTLQKERAALQEKLPALEKDRDSARTRVAEAIDEWKKESSAESDRPDPVQASATAKALRDRSTELADATEKWAAARQQLADAEKAVQQEETALAHAKEELARLASLQEEGKAELDRTNKELEAAKKANEPKEVLFPTYTQPVVVELTKPTDSQAGG